MNPGQIIMWAVFGPAAVVFITLCVKVVVSDLKEHREFNATQDRWDGKR
ncbi:hypothetical protein [Amycolatopsis japonica]